MSAYTILVVEDEPAIRELLVGTLEIEGFEVLEASDVSQAYSLVLQKQPQLILLDWMMPHGASGIDLITRLKDDATSAQIPIIMLTAKGEENNKVYALDAGADDYITKPFSTRELISRIKAVLRRAYGSQSHKQLMLGRLVICADSQQVLIDNQPLTMSATEYRLLKFFVTHLERVYTRAQILDMVWGNDVYIDERTVDVHIRRLRKLLEPFGLHVMIQTVRGTGYRCTQIDTSTT